MTLVAVPAPRTSRSFELVGELYRREPLFAASGFLMLALMVPTFAALLLETRTLAGVNLWMKPLKFQAALALYLLTLAFFAAWLPAGTASRRWYRIYSALVVAAIFAEIIWIGAAAALGVASHFNESSAVWISLYAFMGVSAVTLTSATLVYGVQIHRNQATGLPPALKASLVSGLVLTFVLTLAVAGYMSSTGTHLVGGNLSDTEAAPVFGWARDGGDLRVAHFFATHAMQIIPAFGLFSVLAFGRENRLPVALFSLGFIALTAFTFFQALLGQPFLPMIG
jgi:hypothetical protein